MLQMTLDLEEKVSKSAVSTNIGQHSRAGVFTGNMQLPVHRWFRYSAGFSAEWAAAEIADSRLINPRVLDPFAGSGTTLVAADSAHCSSVGFESHPFIRRVAAAKLQWNADPEALRDAAFRLLNTARKAESSKKDGSVPALLNACFQEAALNRLDALRHAYQDIADSSATSELIWLAITSVLRPCSHVGTAQWQYVLPNKSKARVSDPFNAFQTAIVAMASDMTAAQKAGYVKASRVLCIDARLSGNKEGPFDLVITSPPYPNNYDYADATRLEMTFWREIESWGDLQSSVRQHLLRSCSQHAGAEKLELDRLLADPDLDAIRDELEVACRELEVVRLTKGGRKQYHTMAAAYFSDLAKVWRSLRELCAHGSSVCFVIGDSAPYGVHLPVERWLSELAATAGFKDPTFEKLRDRNVKWKNRKHTVPLHEGCLRVRG